MATLPQVVGIELLGYRKRLQYGIAELRRAHPEWMDNRWSTSSSPSTSRSVRIDSIGPDRNENRDSNFFFLD